MRKYKINRADKPQLPPPEVINKYKDFNQLRTQYSDITKPPKQPLYKNRKLFLFLIIIGLLAWLIAESMEEDKKLKESDPTPTEIQKGK